MKRPTEGTGPAGPAAEAAGNLTITGYTIYFVSTRPRWVLLKLVTNEGLTGFGELTWHGIQGPIHVSRMQELLDQYVIGKSPFIVEQLWSQLYLRPHNRRHSCTITTPVLSAIEIACWDLIGKACSQPVYHLLGGMVHRKLRSHSYLPIQRGDPQRTSLITHVLLFTQAAEAYRLLRDERDQALGIVLVFTAPL